MSLADKINEEIKTAMKAREKEKLEALRSIKSAILMAQTEKGGGAGMSEADELKLVQRLQKQRKDSLEIYENSGREDLAEVERKQLAVIEEFLPKQMSEQEIDSYLRELMDRLQVQGPQDMGKIMGTASKELAGKADGKTISARVQVLMKERV